MKLQRLDAARHDLRAPVTHQRLHQRVVLDQFGRGVHFGGHGLGIALGRAVRDRGLTELQPNGMPGRLQGTLQAFTGGRTRQRLAVDAQAPHIALTGNQLRLQGQLAHQGCDRLAADQLLHHPKPDIAFGRGLQRGLRALEHFGSAGGSG